MSERLVDQAARERFEREWNRNFAVSANAGSGKTTAISRRLAELALSPDGAALLKKTAVVTYTRKAAMEIGQRARNVLLRRLVEEGRNDLAPLDHLERAFFGTIHSFCIKLAQTYGQALGVNLNPTVLTDSDEACWEQFLEQDTMCFSALTAAEVDAFLRHVPLVQIFKLARDLDAATARDFLARRPGPAPRLSEAVLAEILSLTTKAAKSQVKLQANQRLAMEWARRREEEEGFLPLPKPDGKAGGIDGLFDQWLAPLKGWLAEAGAVLAAELAGRYRAWRFEQGVQNYADQIDSAMAVMQDAEALDRIREEGWRVILDEAQDTDPQQFAVLVEIAREPRETLGTWPLVGGAGPRAGHFCMVGDGQQSIYGSRADIANFQRHLEAFGRGEGGELLHFQVTFRAPRAVIGLLNETLPAAFGMERDHNVGAGAGEGAPPVCMQVDYDPLAAGPGNVEGMARRLPLCEPGTVPSGVDGWLVEEARQIGRFLRVNGPEAVGARTWGEICVIAPRNDWLAKARSALEAEGMKVALMIRKNRNGDNPAYAWMTGLLAVVCDMDNQFELAGVLREVFALPDDLLAREMRKEGRWNWQSPEVHPEELARALAILRPFALRVNDEGWGLERFAFELVAGCELGAKARTADPSGVVEAELERLLAEAAELGLGGAGPRDWLAKLLEGIDGGRPAGKEEADAINLLTSHSAKGLEWPVVIPLGLWHPIGKFSETGLHLIRDRVHGTRVFFDGGSVPDETKLAREKERLRENTRLLYVTLTRPRRALVLPWLEGFGPARRGVGLSFAELWGADLSALPEVSVTVEAEVSGGGGQAQEEGSEGGEGKVGGTKVESGDVVAGAGEAREGERAGEEEKLAIEVGLPRRVLPHQMGEGKADQTRLARHETGLDEPMSAGAEEAIDYGLWWHETVEFLPWEGEEAEIEAHGARRLAVAESMGLGSRGKEEWERFRKAPVWAELVDARWTRQAELSVFAPLAEGEEWMDGVIDLVLHDVAAGEVWVVDWKTNRRRVGETDEAVLARLATGYALQLQAYGKSLRDYFPEVRVRLLVYSTAVGQWAEIGVSGD